MNGGDSQNIDFAGTPTATTLADKVLFEWMAPNFSKSERTYKWYLAVGLAIIAIIGYSAWQKDWFVIGVTVVVSAILFWYLHSVIPHDVTYKLTPMGIYADDRFHPFSEMHSFWLVYNEKVKNLYIVFRKKYLPALVINVDKIDPLILKGYLLKKIPEQEGREENLIDRFIRLAGL
jgi:hypothetical protein